MWILSQNRRLLINTDVISYNETNKCIYANDYVLGRYKSEKQVEYIFQQLFTRLSRASHIIENHNGDYVVFERSNPFEMPQEEE